MTHTERKLLIRLARIVASDLTGIGQDSKSEEITKMVHTIQRDAAVTYGKPHGPFEKR
jgi:hypothetical protein